LRFQAKRFRALARWARKIEGKDEPTAEVIGHIARQLLIKPEEAWRIVVGDRRPQGGTEGVAKSQRESTFDEETWAQAEPMFIEAMQEFGLAAKDIGKFANHLVNELRNVYGLTQENLEAMKPYLMRFLKDVRDGTIKITAQRFNR
jgi:hypothetical protein